MGACMQDQLAPFCQYSRFYSLHHAEIRGKQESAGVAAIGGQFDLFDQDGKKFTHENLIGNYSLLYFGFTNCPDICPDELEKLATAIDAVGNCPASVSRTSFNAFCCACMVMTTTLGYACREADGPESAASVHHSGS